MARLPNHNYAVGEVINNKEILKCITEFNKPHFLVRYLCCGRIGKLSKSAIQRKKIERCVTCSNKWSSDDVTIKQRG